MFIKETDVRRLLKEAYKGAGLHIVNDELGLGIFGTTWHMYVFKENLPKEILGAIITLTGEIPTEGEQIHYSQDQPHGQREIFKAEPTHDIYRRAMEAQAGHNVVGSTDIAIEDLFQHQYRLYVDQGEERRVYTIPDKYREMIDAGYCEKDEEFYGSYAMDSWIYWVSSYMAFSYPTYMARAEIKDRAENLLKAGMI